MNDVSTFRLYLMRATYALIFGGLGVAEVLPGIMRHTKVGLMQGVVWSILAAVATLAALGIRYPLKMLPLLFFELLWKTIWLVAVGRPLWSGHQIDAQTWETIKACLMGVVIFPIVIPWPYVLTNYVKKPGDRWK